MSWPSARPQTRTPDAEWTRGFSRAGSDIAARAPVKPRRMARTGTRLARPFAGHNGGAATATGACGSGTFQPAGEAAAVLRRRQGEALGLRCPPVALGPQLLGAPALGVENDLEAVEGSFDLGVADAQAGGVGRCRCALSRALVGGLIRRNGFALRRVDAKQFRRVDRIAAIVGPGCREAAGLDRAEDRALRGSGLLRCLAQAEARHGA